MASLDRNHKPPASGQAAEHMTVVPDIAIDGPDRLGQPSGCMAGTAKS